MNGAGQRIYDLAARIFPICRSITGAGIRETLNILSGYISDGTDVKMRIYNIPSGTQVFDWNIPKEWIIREAYIEDAAHNRIIDFKENNLHVMGYSTDIDKWVELDELKEHIQTLPDQPDWIPYVTSYYKKNYAFCMSEKKKNKLVPGKYHMYIDSEMIDGNLSYGEVLIPGKLKKEIFFSTYICHPSMANNECSGPALASELIRFVASMKERKYTYRFVFIPETIGSITYLSQDDHLRYMQEHVIAGFNLSCVGDDRDYGMVETPYADTVADKALKNILSFRNHYTAWPYLNRGSDERQYCSPMVHLPVVCFCRSKFVEGYPEYHTSADNMELISPQGFQGSYEVVTELVQSFEKNAIYMTTVICEPQLGRRGLFPSISKKGSYDGVKAMMNLIAYANGQSDLFDISDRINVPVCELASIAEMLEANLILKKCAE